MALIASFVFDGLNVGSGSRGISDKSVSRGRDIFFIYSIGDFFCGIILRNW